MNINQQITRELLALSILACVTFILAGHFDVLEAFVSYSRSHEDWELDEILTTSFVIMIALIVILVKRTGQLKNEILRSKIYEKEIELLASTDPLTKLLNRRNFIPMLQDSITQGTGAGRVDAVLFVDIDDFKQVNDTYGHAVGDDLLIKISDILKDSVRQTDVVSRFAGDEFVIYLSGIHSKEEAKIVAEKIMDNAKSAHFTDPTLSIGIALSTDEEMSAHELISAADKAMYLAKEEGKNGYYFLN